MKIKEIYSIRSIDPLDCREWILKKHYAHRMPSITYSFGLFRELSLIGILTIGKPASPNLCDGVCGINNSQYVYELNRLCVNDGLEKNVLSYFVSSVLKSLSNIDIILISYADTSMGHNGYIYQATNWIYTGATKERTDIGTDEKTHSRHYDKNIDYSINRKLRSSKHRYIYFLGKHRKEFRKALAYKIESYPKGENQRYNSSFIPTIQGNLF